jgi:hypothetical protein
VVHAVPVFTLAGLALGIVAASIFIYTKFTKFLKE